VKSLDLTLTSPRFIPDTRVSNRAGVVDDGGALAKSDKAPARISVIGETEYSAIAAWSPLGVE